MLTLEHLHELKQKLVLGSSSTQGKLTKEQFRELLTVFLRERDLESHFGRMFSKVCTAVGGCLNILGPSSFMLSPSFHLSACMNLRHRPIVCLVFQELGPDCRASVVSVAVATFQL